MELANSQGVRIRPAVSEDSGQILRLLGKANYSHYHLDWMLPVDLIGFPGFVVAVDTLTKADDRFLGCLAITADPPPAAWVRLVGLPSRDLVEGLLEALVEAVVPTLQRSGVTEIGWLCADDWPNEFLAALGFNLHNWIVTFILKDLEVQLLTPTELEIRPASLDDMGQLAQLERAAFAPLWRHSEHGLRRAYARSLAFDVALAEDQVVGFQYTVQGRDRTSAHLVRLTVLPSHHKLGVGSALMANLIKSLVQLGSRQITLNTQADNTPSHRLYEKFNFRRLPDRAALWVRSI